MKIKEKLVVIAGKWIFECDIDWKTGQYAFYWIVCASLNKQTNTVSHRFNYRLIYSKNITWMKWPIVMCSLLFHSSSAFINGLFDCVYEKRKDEAAVYIYNMCGLCVLCCFPLNKICRYRFFNTRKHNVFRKF